MVSQARAELSKSPWLLKAHGGYIEMSEGFFRRAEAIQTVRGVISVRYLGNDRTLLSTTFPLSKKGLADFKKLDRTKFNGAPCDAAVLVYINGDHAGRLVFSNGKDPIDEWESFETAVGDAQAQVFKLLTMASKD